MITGYGILALRDPHGIRPLVYGRRLVEGDGADEYEWMVASESGAVRFATHAPTCAPRDQNTRTAHLLPFSEHAPPPRPLFISSPCRSQRMPPPTPFVEPVRSDALNPCTPPPLDTSLVCG
jgi:hypothetical protein